MAIDYSILNEVKRLSASLEGVKVTPKQAELIRLIKSDGYTPAQLDSWAATNPVEAQNCFYNPSVVSMLVGDPVLQKRVYDSLSGATLSLNSSVWWSEFVRYLSNVNILVSSVYGLRALWEKGDLLTQVFENRATSGVWSRFLELSTAYDYSWSASFSGRPAWAPAAAVNGTYYPHPAATGRTIIVSFEPSSTNQTYAFNTRLRGGPEIIGATSNSAVNTFAAHLNAAGARTTGTGSTALSVLRLLHA